MGVAAAQLKTDYRQSQCLFAYLFLLHLRINVCSRNTVGEKKETAQPLCCTLVGVFKMLSVNIFDLAQSSLSRTKKTLFFGCAKISTPRDDGNSLLSTSFGSRLASCCFVFSCVQCCSQCLPILSHSKYVYPVYLLSGVFMKQRSTSHNVSRALASNGVYSHE